MASEHTHTHTVYHYKLNGMLAEHVKALITYHKNNSYIALSEGLHFNAHFNAHELASSGSIQDSPSALKLSTRIEEFMVHCDTVSADCFFPETSPQHFDTPSGMYSAGRPRRCREPRSIYKPSSKHVVFNGEATWRNDVLYRVAARHPNLTVMRVFDALAPLTFAHHNNDCTHWLFDAQVWEPWHLGLITALKAMHKAPKI